MKRRVRRSHRVPRLAVPVCLAAAGVLGSASAAVAQPVSAPQAVTSDAKVNALLKRMTLSEKLTMIEGSAEVHNASDQYQAGYMPGVKKLGIPALELTDGPPGVITRQDSTGMTSTMGVGATFSRSDARANGTVIGRDARDLGQDVALQPFVNMDRDTSWSRGFNTFGEDPLLTGLTGAAEITGIQSQGVMAQVKHFIAYDGGNNVEVNEQALHEIYLQPFTDAVDAGVASIMCSYNIVNGEQSCGNKSNLVGILRNQLHFKGFVTSDWGANHSTLSINGGVDLEMPGGGGPAGVTIPTYFTKQAMTKAIKAGKVSMTTLNGAVGDILYEMDRFGLLSGHSKHTVNAENHKADEKVVLKTARDATTLLKNHADALPLSKKSLSDLALIGPGAGQTIATNSGGEAAGGLLSEQPSALSELKRMAGGTSHINYAVGDDLSGTPIPAARLSHGGQPGLLQTDTRTKATSVTPTLDLTTGDKRALPAGHGGHVDRRPDGAEHRGLLDQHAGAGRDRRPDRRRQADHHDRRRLRDGSAIRRRASHRRQRPDRHPRRAGQQPDADAPHRRRPHDQGHRFPRRLRAPGAGTPQLGHAAADHRQRRGRGCRRQVGQDRRRVRLGHRLAVTSRPRCPTGRTS